MFTTVILIYTQLSNQEISANFDLRLNKLFFVFNLYYNFSHNDFIMINNFSAYSYSNSRLIYTD